MQQLCIADSSRTCFNSRSITPAVELAATGWVNTLSALACGLTCYYIGLICIFLCSIREIVPSSGFGPCPICRKPLRRTDLIDTISEVCTLTWRLHSNTIYMPEKQQFITRLFEGQICTPISKHVRMVVVSVVSPQLF